MLTFCLVALLPHRLPSCTVILTNIVQMSEPTNQTPDDDSGLQGLARGHMDPLSPIHPNNNSTNVSNQTRLLPQPHWYNPAPPFTKLYGPAQTQAHRKPVRATQVCTNCRARKQRCDQGRPCQSCKSNKIDCQYRDGPPQRYVLA